MSGWIGSPSGVRCRVDRFSASLPEASGLEKLTSMYICCFKKILKAQFVSTKSKLFQDCLSLHWWSQTKIFPPYLHFCTHPTIYPPVYPHTNLPTHPFLFNVMCKAHTLCQHRFCTDKLSKQIAFSSSMGRMCALTCSMNDL